MPLGASRISFLAKTQVTAVAEVIRKKIGVSAVGNAQVDTAQSKFGGASAIFDGTTDYLTIGETGLAQSDDFTYEGWVRFNTLPSSYYYMFGGADDRLALYMGIRDRGSSVYTINTAVDDGSNAYYYNVTLPTGPSTGTWYHFAMVKEGADIRVYWDGSEVTTVYNETGTMTSDHGWQNLDRIANWTGGTDYSLDGHMDEVRFSNTARYTTSFTPDTTPFTNDDNTLLLLHMDGTDGSTFFEDDNGTRTQVGVRAEGSGQIDTAQYKFGGASFVADGTGDDNLAIDENAFDWTKISDHAGSDNYTLECWIRSTNVATTNAIFGTRTSTASHNWDLEIRTNNGNGTLRWFNGNSELYYSAGGVVSADTWHHIAAVIEGADLTVYVDGTAVITQTRTDSNNTGGSDFFIGKGGYPTLNKFYGNIDEFRLSDIARYTTSFTPDTEPFTNDTNTLLLLHMDGADGSTDFRDDNGKGRAPIGLTVVGDAQIDTGQSKIGGASALFDGTADRLYTQSESTLVPTSEFCIECWARFDNVTSIHGVFQLSTTAGGLETGNTLKLGLQNQFTEARIYTYGGIYTTSGLGLTANTWYHFALVRNSGTTKLYVDGTEQLTLSDTNTYTASNLVIGGVYSTSYLMDGYIDEFRVSSTARYTGSFTPSTTPFQNDANTLILLHMDGTDGSTTFIDDNGTY